MTETNRNEIYADASALFKLETESSLDIWQRATVREELSKLGCDLEPGSYDPDPEHPNNKETAEAIFYLIKSKTRPDVFMKVYKPSRTSGIAEEEIRILKGITASETPNIIEYLGSISYIKDPVIFLKYYPNLTLMHKIVDEGYPNSTEIATLFEKIGGAILACHNGTALPGEPLAHRDLKPDNILIDEDDEPVVTDFNVSSLIISKFPSRIIDGESQNYRQSGTPAFTTREMMEPNFNSSDYGPNYDFLIDQYSLAVMFYYLISKGKMPFGQKQSDLLNTAIDEAGNQTIKDYINSQSEYTSLTNIELNDSNYEQWRIKLLDQILQKALSEDPQDRYQNFEDFYNDFLKALQIEYDGQTKLSKIKFKLKKLFKSN